MIVLTIPEATPSRNQLDKMHWARRHKIRGDWQWLVKQAVLKAHVHVHLIPHARVTIERFAKRRLDHDNFVGGTKQLMDSLVSEGFFKDDSVKHVSADYRQSIGEPCTLVRIESLRETEPC